MYKKVLFKILCFLCLLAGIQEICFSAINDPIPLSINVPNTIENILNSKDTDISLGVCKAGDDAFAGKNYSDAYYYFKYVVDNYPDSEIAMWAQAGIATAAIHLENDVMSQAAINKLLVDYSGHEDMLKAVRGIAVSYRDLNKFEQVRQLYKNAVYARYGQGGQLRDCQAAVFSEDILGNAAGVRDAVIKLATDYRDNEDSIDTVMQKADSHRDAKDYKNAIWIYQKVVDAWPDSTQAMWAQSGLIYSYVRLDDEISAEQVITKLCVDYSKNKDIAMAVCFIADNYRELRKRDKADTHYRMIVSSWPQSTYGMWATMHLAISDIKAGDDAAAAALVEDLFADYSNHQHFVRAVSYVAGRYYNSQKIDKAMSLYQRIADLHPEEVADVWFQVVSLIVNLQLTNTDVSLASIDKLQVDFAFDPDLPEAMLWVGEIYYKKGTELLKNKNSADMAKECFQKVTAICKAAIGKYPDSPHIRSAYFMAGDSFNKLGEYEKSSEYFQKAADYYPQFSNRWRAIFMIGQNCEELVKNGVVAKKEGLNKAQSLYQQLLKEYPDSRVARKVQDKLKKIEAANK